MSETRSHDARPDYSLPTKLQIAGCSFCELVFENRYSKVYFGTEPTLNLAGNWVNRKVAIKLISLDGGRAYERLARYNQEIEAFYKITHPNIVPLYRTKISASSIAFVMGRIDGPTLEESRTMIVWTLEMVMVLVSQLSSALSSVHDHGIIHGDVHTGNVMLWRQPDPKQPITIKSYLLDFGLSRMWGKDQSSPLTPQNDILGLANLILMVLWPQKDIKRDVERGLTNSIIWVLYKATRRDCPYKTIDEFASAFQKAVNRSSKPITGPRRKAYIRLTNHSAVNPDDARPDTHHMKENEPVAVTSPSPEIAMKSATTTQTAQVVADAPVKTTTVPKPITARHIAAIMVIVLAIGALLTLLLLTQNPASAKISSAALINGVVVKVMDERFVVFNPAKNEVAYTYNDYPAKVSAYSPDGAYLAVGRSIFDARTGKVVQTFDSAPIPVAETFNVDGSILAIHDGIEVTLWDVQTGYKLHTIPNVEVRNLNSLMNPLNATGYTWLRHALEWERREMLSGMQP